MTDRPKEVQQLVSTMARNLGTEVLQPRMTQIQSLIDMWYDCLPDDGDGYVLLGAALQVIGQVNRTIAEQAVADSGTDGDTDAMIDSNERLYTMACCQLLLGMIKYGDADTLMQDAYKGVKQ